MNEVDVTVSANNVDRFISLFEQYLSLLLEGALSRECPVDKGGLRNSIKVYVENGKLKISMFDYGIYVEYGTLPHIIKPTNAKALHWKSGGKDVFAKQVMHPGTKANPFIRRTFFSKIGTLVRDAAKSAERDVNLI